MPSPIALWQTSALLKIAAHSLRSYELFIGLRYTRAKRRNHFISFISLISMLGMALGGAMVRGILPQDESMA